MEPASFSMGDVLAAAQGWAAAGRRVFPVQPGGKKPAVAWGTTPFYDDDALRALFNPLLGHGLGLPTGDGLIVIDVDLAKGAEIPEWLPATYTVRTRSGGMHFYYLVDDEVPNSAGRLGDAIDVRGDGGYVVAPPTEGYHVLVAQPIAQLDTLELLAVRRRTGAFTRERFEFPETTIDPAGNAVVIDPIGEGQRNDWLLRACGHARESGIDDEGTLQEWAEGVNQLYIDPPLDEAEVRHVVRSSLRYLGS